MKKLANTAKKLDVVAKVLFWILLVSGVGFVALAIIFACLGDKIFDSATYSLTFGPAEFFLSEQYSPDVRALRLQFGAGAVLVGVSVVITCMAVHYIRKILDPMKNERPFDGTVHKNIKKLAWLVLIGGAVGSLMSTIGTALSAMAYNLEEIFASEIISGVEINAVSDCSFIIGFALLYLLSYVFKYGEELQIQSDETL